jgi:hypothetical protein
MLIETLLWELPGFSKGSVHKKTGYAFIFQGNFKF